MKQTSLDSLRNHLFEALEGVKNIGDPNASESEICSVDKAKAICEISTKIIDSYKVEVDAMAVIAKAENHKLVERFATSNGMLIEQTTDK